MKKMTTYQTVDALDPIPNADNIETASIKGWKCVVKKDQFKVGDKVIYIPIDSLLERRDWNDFLADKNKPEKPIRIKTMKLRGQYSQGLVLAPKDVLEGSVSEDDLDVALGVTKYEKPIPACLAGVMKGDFPTSLISKTDEELLQNIPEILEKFNGDAQYVITVKYDGSSGTFGIDENDEFFVCSRNMMLTETETNTFWKLARSYDIENRLRAMMKKFGWTSIIIQGEVYGEGIQKNPLGIKGHELAIFNMGIYRTKESFGLKESMANWYTMEGCLYLLGIPPVEQVSQYMEKPLTVEKFQKVANDLKYLNGNAAEGIVVRLANDPNVSFKVINQSYKD